MRLTTHHLCEVAVALAALVVASCGGADPSPPAPNPTAARAGKQVERYVARVTQIRGSVDDAKVAFFHAPPRKAAIRRQTVAMQKAYAAAVRELEGLDPPKGAADVHQRVRSEWSKRAHQLAQV